MSDASLSADSSDLSSITTTTTTSYTDESIDNDIDESELYEDSDYDEEDFPNDNDDTSDDDQEKNDITLKEVKQLIEVDFRDKELDQQTLINSIRQYKYNDNTNKQPNIDDLVLKAANHSTQLFGDEAAIYNCIRRSFTKRKNYSTREEWDIEVDYINPGNEIRKQSNEWKCYGETGLRNIYITGNKDSNFGLPERFETPDDVIDLLDEFKLSKNLMIEIPVRNIISLRVIDRLLILDMNSTPLFYNRRIGTQAELRNRFRARIDFTPNKVASKHTRHYVVVEDASQLFNTVGMLLAVDPDLKDKIDALPVNLSTSILLNEQDSLNKQLHFVTYHKNRKGIKNNAISDEMKQYLYSRNLIKAMDDDIPEGCLRDAACTLTISDLKDHLDRKELTLCCDTTVTVADLIHRNNICPNCENSNQYYSFCLSEVLDSSCHSHCNKCGVCRHWRYWHCDACNNCSYDLNRTTCQFCGTTRGSSPGLRIKLKPKSWFDSVQERSQNSDAVDSSSDSDDSGEDSEVDQIDL
ncbi:KMT2C [Acrasis kona]|uniref:KMT2C n=1 Tax=Acrasis kona TaxID=1008807 RepID=A0AAW2Z3E8_9EUKA